MGILDKKGWECFQQFSLSYYNRIEGFADFSQKYFMQANVLLYVISASRWLNNDNSKKFSCTFSNLFRFT